MSISLIAGLGNPGIQYEQTRHNVGWWWLDLLLQDSSSSFKSEKKFFADYAKTSIAHRDIHLLKPHTFMNESGKSLLAAKQFYKLPLEQILVVHDDLDLPAGTIRFKKGGGHGGHNGLRDIIRVFGGQDFYRLRIGIGHPGQKNKVHGYVLSKPSAQDVTLIDDAICRSIHLLDWLVKGQLDKFTQLLHT